MKVWILGAGVFGQLAVDRIRERSPEADIVSVDDDATGLDRVRGRARTFLADGMDFLAERLGRGSDPDWIVPAIPVHVAFLWIWRMLADTHEVKPVPVPRDLVPDKWHPMPAADDGLYLSRADFTCPDDCAEPAGTCTVTGKPRDENLYDVLAEPGRGFTPCVIRSVQLAPGVGGFRPGVLFAARDMAATATGNVLIVTACRCHGVVHGLSIDARN
ncbi:MAG: potassium transporter [Desulfatibacillaceae bacterium]